VRRGGDQTLTPAADALRSNSPPDDRRPGVPDPDEAFDPPPPPAPVVDPAPPPPGVAAPPPDGPRPDTYDGNNGDLPCKEDEPEEEDEDLAEGDLAADAAIAEYLGCCWDVGDDDVVAKERLVAVAVGTNAVE